MYTTVYMMCVQDALIGVRKDRRGCIKGTSSEESSRVGGKLNSFKDVTFLSTDCC